jgi:hypothetical protein
VLGSQFAVLLTDMRHLAGKVSVLGQCGDLELAREIAARVADGEPHTLLQVELAQPVVPPQPSASSDARKSSNRSR